MDHRIAFFVLSLLLSLASAFAQEQTIEVDRVLGEDFVLGQTPDVSSGAFTFAMRVKLLGQAESQWRADGQGMLFSVASGYYDGMRAHFCWITHKVVFQIGKQPAAVILRSTKGILPGVWHDVVCSYDGKVMRIWLDGELSGEMEYAGPLNMKDAPIKVGNGGYGVGANRMDVDRLNYYPRALTEEEIAKRFEDQFPAEGKKTLERTARYSRVEGAYNVSTSKDVLESLLAEPDLPEDFRFEVQNDYLFRFGTPAQIAEAAKKEAEWFLTENVPMESFPRDTRNVSWLWGIASRLEKTNQTELLGRLREKYPEEFMRRDGVFALLNSAKRVRKLEKDALEQAQAVENLRVGFTVYVSPDGSDANDGEPSTPVRNLEKAIQLVSAWQNANPDQMAMVTLMSGTYQFDQTIEFNGVKDLFIVSAPGARAVLTGGKTLTHWEPVTDGDVLRRLPGHVRGKVLECDLKAAGVTDFGQLRDRGYGTGDSVNPIPSLYVNGEAQTLARFPNVGEDLLKFGPVEGQTFGYDFDAPDHWQISDAPEENDIWANGLFTWEWASHLRKVRNIDRVKKTFTVNGVELTGRFHYYLVNILEELDQPGEYFIDRQRGAIYYLPDAGQLDEEGRFQGDVEFAALEKPLVRLTNCRNVVLKNLTLKCGRESGVFMTDCSRCYVKDSTIEQFGGHGAVIRGGSFCGALGCRIREMGACGIRLNGGSRATLEPARHLVYNCEISDFSRIDRAYAPAVHTTGCGFVIVNNLIYDSPHHALMTAGNDIYVARNEIHSVVYEFSDQSGIDLWGDPTFRGLVIEENFWHDISGLDARCGQAGIRLDDAISGVLMIGNVFYRCSGGMFGGIQIHGGHDNVCLRNVFIDCKYAFSFSPWYDARYSEFMNKFPAFVQSPVYRKTYPTMDRLTETLNRNYILGNTVIGCGEFQRCGFWNIFLENTFSTQEIPVPTGTPFNRREWIQTFPNVPDLERVGSIK